MTKRIENVDLINDQNITIKCIIEDGNTSFEFNNGLDYLEKFVRVENKEVKLGLKTIGHITNDGIKIDHPITTTELRLLKALYNNMVSLGLEDADFLTYADRLDKVLRDNVKILNRKDHINPINMTELHTHFIEILSSEELIEFLNGYDISYPMNEYGKFDLKSKKTYTYNEIESNGWTTNLLNAFRINPSETGDFSLLQEKIKNRQEIIKFAKSEAERRATKTEDYKKEKEENNLKIKKLKEKQNKLSFNKDVLDEVSKLLKRLLTEGKEKTKKKIYKKLSDLYLAEDLYEPYRKLISVIAFTDKMPSLSLLNKIGEVKEKIGERINKVNNDIQELGNFHDNFVNGYLYNDLLERCLRKLDSEGIAYTEISFSNANRIEYMASKHMDDKRFRFLYSINRNPPREEGKRKKAATFKDYSKNLESLLADKLIRGTDIMGNETELNGENYEYFKDGLEWILPVLHIHPGSILRIHASEDKDCTENLYKTLLALKEVNEKFKVEYEEITGKKWGTIPPPQIRIGHAINIERTPELLDLMKNYFNNEIIVEFNISSNYALGNAEDLTDLPLQYYKDNGIPYTVSTDGGGMYVTSGNQERNIVHNIIDDKGNPGGNNNGGGKNSGNDDGPFTPPEGPKDPSQEDIEALHKFMKYKGAKGSFNKVHDNYEEALKYENELCGTNSDSEKVKNEINRLQRYIMDMDIDFDFDRLLFDKTISEIVKMNEEDSQKAKIYLYVYETEFVPGMESFFKTVEYFENKKKKTNNMNKPKKNNVIKDTYKKKKHENPELKGYIEAMNMENEIFGNLPESAKVQVELKRFIKFLKNNDFDLSMFSGKMLVIEKHIDDGTDLSKIFLYLLEQEIGLDFKTRFKTLEYIDQASQSGIYNNAEKGIINEFEMVKRIYLEEQLNTSIKGNGK